MKDIIISTSKECDRFIFIRMVLDLLSIGLINDMYAESRNDDCKYATLATQEDFDRF